MIPRSPAARSQFTRPLRAPYSRRCARASDHLAAGAAAPPATRLDTADGGEGEGDVADDYRPADALKPLQPYFSDPACSRLLACIPTISRLERAATGVVDVLPPTSGPTIEDRARPDLHGVALHSRCGRAALHLRAPRDDYSTCCAVLCPALQPALVWQSWPIGADDTTALPSRSTDDCCCIRVASPSPTPTPLLRSRRRVETLEITSVRARSW